jgi:hypothetical protein
MGTTPKLGIPYVEPGDQLSIYPTQDKNQALAVEALIALPNPVDTYVSADQTITATASTETPTQVRVSMTNPHPTERMLALVWQNLRMVLAGTGGAGYSLISIVSGPAATAIPQWGPVMSPQAVESMVQGGWYLWIPAGATCVFGINAWKTSQVSSMVIRYVHNSVIPQRYEGA